MTTPTVPDAAAPGMTRRDVLRRGGLVGGALLWVAPAVQVIDLTAASADIASGDPPNQGDLPSHLELLVEVKVASHTWGGHTYPLPLGAVVALKYDITDDGWGGGKVNPGSCIPSGPAYAFVNNANVVADFKANIPAGTQMYGGKSTYVVQVPPRYVVKYAWGKKRSGTDMCSAPVVMGNVYYFQGT